MMEPSCNLITLQTLAKMQEIFEKDPDQLSPTWKSFFVGLELASQELASLSQETLQVYCLIESYRRWGHLLAHFNPLDEAVKEVPWQLALATHGLAPKDLSTLFPSFQLLEKKQATLEEIIQALQSFYSSQLGFEYKHIERKEIVEFVQKQVESSPREISEGEKKEALHFLQKAELFESFLHIRYPGKKRFSLEGMETFIPLLQAALQAFAKKGGKEAVIGMAHRGRLNVLSNILQKPYSLAFYEFESAYAPSEEEGSGDTNYHKGFVSEVALSSTQKVRLHLVANPSHLESVNPVAMGMTRALQDLKDSSSILAFLVHGDASVAGQGVVYECMQMSYLKGYTLAGVIHVILDNQLGFTASKEETRSTLYPSDIAKSFNAPIFHVNVEDIESGLKVVQLAIELRQTFGCDVFLHLCGYRKYGHNETDDPFFTHPLEYQKIQQKKSIYELYLQKLVEEKTLREEEVYQKAQEFKASLEREKEKLKDLSSKRVSLEEMYGEFHPEVFVHKEEELFIPIATQVAYEKLQEVAKKYGEVPSSFSVHPKLQKTLQAKIETLFNTEKLLDFAFAEILAFASLLEQKVGIRLVGQDAKRGTFNQRHAVWFDQKTGEEYCSLQHISQEQAPFYVYNSFLSEFAAMGYEFGYNQGNLAFLTLWEAQYGDFANGAQIILDQYLSSSEQKWKKASSLVLLLPHGYEGAGPEHSSARIERFLALSATNNWFVVNPTTPSQYFHLLRRQALRKKKKPLVVFTPKSLLRHPLAKSSVIELVQGGFAPFLEDPTSSVKAANLVLCSGKIFYELWEKKQKEQKENYALLRIEQLYPFDWEAWKKILSRYKQVKRWIWVQEEPENMGAWHYLYPLLKVHMPKLEYIGRKKSASPSCGASYQHRVEQEVILQRVFDGN